MTVGRDTKEPRERASRYATGVLLFSTRRRRETQRSRLKNVSSIHREIKKGIRRILYSDLIQVKLTVCVCVCVCTGISHQSEDNSPPTNAFEFSLVENFRHHGLVRFQREVFPQSSEIFSRLDLELNQLRRARICTAAYF